MRPRLLPARPSRLCQDERVESVRFCVGPLLEWLDRCDYCAFERLGRCWERATGDRLYENGGGCRSKIRTRPWQPQQNKDKTRTSLALWSRVLQSILRQVILVNNLGQNIRCSRRGSSSESSIAKRITKRISGTLCCLYCRRISCSKDRLWLSHST